MNGSKNAIIRYLSERERNFLAANARAISLNPGDTVFSGGEVVEHVYFPETGAILIVTEAENGEVSEGGVAGVRSAAGLFEALGSGVMRSRGVVQTGGRAWKVGSSACRALHQTSEAFRRAAALAAELHLVEARQSLLCLAHHPLEQRLARWLLEMAERDGNQPPAVLITQEMLGVVLTVQRTTVTSVVARLRRAGLISTLRGAVELLDIDGLERTACRCRSSVREAEVQILDRSRDYYS